MIRSVAKLGWLVLFGVGVTACAPSVYEAPPAAPPDARTNVVSVLGRGEVSQRPDLARVTIGVSAVAPTAADASSRVNREMSAVIAAIKKEGVADKDLQTANLSIHYERVELPPPAPVSAPDAPTPPSKPGGAAAPATSPVAAPPAAPPAPRGQYRVTNTVRVTIRDLDKVGALLDAAVTAGANEVWGISFGIGEPEALEAKARDEAVKDARDRAEALAKAQGLALGEVVSVSDHTGGGAPRLMLEAARDSAFGYSGAPVAPGEVSVSAQLEVVYRLAPAGQKTKRVEAQP